MPAASEPGRVPPPLAPVLPHTWRPLGARIVGLVLGVGLVVVFGAAWLSFDDETQATFTGLQIGTVLFFAFWGSQLRRSRGDPGAVATAARITVVVATLFGFFYDLEPLVPFLALGLLWRRRSAGEGRVG